MALLEELERSGHWLFRWRSYLPIILVIPLLLAIRQFDWPFHSYLFHEVWEFVCLGISLSGLVVRALIVGHTPLRTSGRNTREQIADQLNVAGMYSIVRHPLYLGNFLIWIGIVLVLMEWWLAVIFIMAFWIYYERIMVTEEAFLRRKFGAEFEEWAARTPAFLPRFRLWRRPELPFSLRNVLKREYTALLGILAGHFLMEIGEHLIKHHEPLFEPIWVALFFVGVLCFLVLRTLKRHTQLLNVEGR